LIRSSQVTIRQGTR